MNALIPVENKEIPLSSCETAISKHRNYSKFPVRNHMSRYLFLLFFLWIFKYRNRTVAYFDAAGNPIQPKPFSGGLNLTDPAVLDKISFLLDSIRKVSALQELKKNLLESGTDGKPGLNLIAEMLKTLKKTNSETDNAQEANVNAQSEEKDPVNSISNILSLFDKLKNMKKLTESQNMFKNETGNKDMNAQIDQLIEIIRPMLPPEQVANIDNLKKMAQMMKIMSLLDLPKEGKEESEPNSNEEKTQEE